MYCHAATVHSFGMSTKLLVASSPGVAKELPITCTKGIRHLSANPVSTTMLTPLKIFSPGVRRRSLGFRTTSFAGSTWSGVAALLGLGAGVGVVGGAHRPGAAAVT